MYVVHVNIVTIPEPLKILELMTFSFFIIHVTLIPFCFILRIF